MATGFTDEEVREAVDKFLLRQVSVNPLPNGARNVVQLRDTVYDLITTILLLRPDAFFYAVWQATNKLRGLVVKQIAALDSIAANGPGVTRPSKKVTSTSELTNARAALLEINSGLNARTVGVSGSIGPAVARFRRSVGRFLEDEITKNVVVNNSVVDTAEGLKTSIRTEWADAVTRHDDIVALSSSIALALSQLASVRLPQSAVQSLVSKIQSRLVELESTMAGTDAVAESKQAMLDLLTMRTLLTKASSFRAPALKLMPLVGDSSALLLVDSPGVEASISSTASAPYNYDPGATLSLSVNGGTPVVVALPRSSRAEIRSKVISPWAEPPGSSEIFLSIDASGSSGPFVLPAVPAYGSGPAAAAAFDAGLLGVSVTWDASTSQLVFQSEDETDVSRVRMSTSTAPTTAFAGWFGGLLEGLPSPPTAEELVQAISSSSSLVQASVQQTAYGTFTGTRETLPANVIWNKLAQGANLATTAGSAVVISPSINFNKLIKPGMAVEITSPAPVAGQYVVVSVDGGALTLDTTLASTATATYYAGPDYRVVPAGARVHVVSAATPLNRGYYYVDSGGGVVAGLPLTRTLVAADSSLVTSVYKKNVVVNARGTTASSGLGVTAVNPVGFAVTAELPAELTEFDLQGAGDFVFRGVRPGDRVTLASPGLVSYDRLVESVTTTTLVVTEPVPYEAGAWQFSIQSDRVYRYTALVDYPLLVDPPPSPYVNQFLSSTYVVDFASLDSLIGRLFRGGVYTGQVSSAVSQYRSDLSSLKQALDGFSVPSEKSIDNAIKTMREQGLDRAADLFLGLRLVEFFTMEPEGVSYSTWLTYQAARAAREATPVSKTARSALVYQEWRLLSFQAADADLSALRRTQQQS